MMNQSEHSGESFPQNSASENQNVKNTGGTMSAQSPTNNLRSKQNERILRLIQEAKQNFSTILDLSKMGLRKLPSEVLELTNLQYLYLEGNELTCLPENFFDALPKLQWLDLRRNYIIAIPSVFLSRHENLRNILLENNELRTLPLELGLVKNLSGLNINNNPLEFPPPDVLERGTQDLLKYLRDTLHAKSQGKLPINTDLRIHELRISEEGDSHSYMENVKDQNGIGGAEEWEQQNPEMDDLSKLKSSHRRASLESDGSLSSYDSQSMLSHARDISSAKYYNDLNPMTSTRFNTERHDLGGPGTLKLSLNKPTNYDDIRKKQYEKIKKAGALGVLENSMDRKKKLKKLRKVNKYPKPPPIERIEEKLMEERRQIRMKDLREKQNAIIQRKKDKDLLSGWRDETKQQQRKLQFDAMRKGPPEFLEPVRKAPFDIDQDHIKIPTNEQRIKEEVKATHEKIRRAASPNTIQKLEMERRMRDNELKEKLKKHSEKMAERRSLPKKSPQEEMQLAQRELEIVKRLQKELIGRYNNLHHWTQG
ncbi:unnamed protein product [Owenia fusiformis]|uniref:Uncharacterized protein n=1 Tax=Owenia fusiformis TaxID=6347 RepID=A0A8J1XEL2_OWEFU|nr:unnamed protein product [Owenia fusiformis]